MIEQSDIADIIGQLADSPVRGSAYKRQLEALMRHYARGGGAARDRARRPAPRAVGIRRPAVCARVQAVIPRLHAARPSPQKGGCVSKFEDDIQARLAIIARMIPSAKVAERRALQRERADLEEKLRKVSA